MHGTAFYPMEGTQNQSKAQVQVEPPYILHGTQNLESEHVTGEAISTM